MIRVIRPSPPPPPSAFESATPGHLIVFALVGGAAGSSVLYLIANPEKRGKLFSYITPQSSLTSRYVLSFIQNNILLIM